MSKDWKLVGEALGSSASGLMPPPADSALVLVAKFASLTGCIIDANAETNENQQLVEQLCQRAVDVARIVEQYAPQYKSDVCFCQFVSNFKATMADADTFVAQFLGHENRPQMLLSESGLKKEFIELRKRVDAVSGDFRNYVLSNMDSRGPQQLIKHPKLRTFWMYRMANSHEVKWVHFWDHFLEEFPTVQPFFSGATATENKARFQAKALSRDEQFVGPWEINNLFQPYDAPVEQLVARIVGVEAPILPMIAGLAHQDSTNTREIQFWKGYWMQGNGRGNMTTELFFTMNNKIFGCGSDIIGEFTWTGECNDKNIHLMKQYVHQHTVQYDGIKTSESTIKGSWSIDFAFHDRSQEKRHIFTTDTFYLERQLPLVSESGTQGAILMGHLRLWTGFYLQSGSRGNMTTELVFTDQYKIYGNGKDPVGCFTWLGYFYEEGLHTHVDMTKKYEGKHNVFYHGKMMRGQDSNVTIQGKWLLPNEADQGTFCLCT